MSQDYIVRATAANHQLRLFAVTSRNLVEKARQIHGTSPVATAALGRLLTAGSMMGSMMKNDTDVLTLQIKGDGPLGGITVTADAKANVKGFVENPDAMLPPKNGKLDVGGAVGIGLLNICGSFAKNCIFYYQMYRGFRGETLVYTVLIPYGIYLCMQILGHKKYRSILYLLMSGITCLCVCDYQKGFLPFIFSVLFCFLIAGGYQIRRCLRWRK